MCYYILGIWKALKQTSSVSHSSSLHSGTNLWQFSVPPESHHTLSASQLLSGWEAWTPRAEPPRRNASGRRAQQLASGPGNCEFRQSRGYPDSWRDRADSPKNHSTLVSPLGGTKDVLVHVHVQHPNWNQQVIPLNPMNLRKCCLASVRVS